MDETRLVSENFYGARGESVLPIHVNIFVDGLTNSDLANYIVLVPNHVRIRRPRDVYRDEPLPKGSEADFEQIWLSRDSHLDRVPGL